jgi:hypothetical protein
MKRSQPVLREVYAIETPPSYDVGYLDSRPHAGALHPLVYVIELAVTKLLYLGGFKAVTVFLFKPGSDLNLSSKSRRTRTSNS